MIVLCLILDSRQNDDLNLETVKLIVLCLILDSRQNDAVNGVKAGLIVLCLILDSRQNLFLFVFNYFILYCALFWIQGKTKTLFLLRD